MSCIRTTFSSIFDRSGRLETGRYFFSFGGDQGFSSSGLTTAFFNLDGTSPDRSDLFMMFVGAGRRSTFSLSSAVGSGSSSKVFCAVFLTMLCASFSDTGEN